VPVVVAAGNNLPSTEPAAWRDQKRLRHVAPGKRNVFQMFETLEHS
jgi:hypothetical protein